MQDHIALKSEVYFPNLVFESHELDFGCILNDTESVQYITMTNRSPLEVAYNWSFLKRPPVQRIDPNQHDEGVDMQSECETDSLDEQTDDDNETGVEQSTNTHTQIVQPSTLRWHDSTEQDDPSLDTPQSVQGSAKDSVQEDSVKGSVKDLLLHQVENQDVSRSPKTSEAGGVRPQPWKLLVDPFTPIRIEQVCSLHAL